MQTSNDDTSTPRTIFQSLPILKDWVKYIIGKEGKTIDWIRNTSKARVFVDEDTTNLTWRYVKLQGSPGNVDNAKKKIITLLWRCAEMTARNNNGGENNDLEEE